MNGRSLCALVSLAIALPWLSVVAATAPAAPAAPAVETGDNPYASVVARNIFDLKPIPQHNPADDVPTTPPPKITPNGIMTIFGKLQVLFKVQATTPGQPPKEISYTMGEGERQDDIEVQKIDERAATITFNNHGKVETLELSKTAAGANPVPTAPGAPTALPHGLPLPTVAGANPGGPPATIGFGGRFGRSRGAGASTGQTGAGTTGAPGFASAPPSAPTVNGANAEAISPEAQIIMMEAQRAEMLQKGDSAAAIIPPTPITDQVIGGNSDPAPTAPGQ